MFDRTATRSAPVNERTVVYLSRERTDDSRRNPPNGIQCGCGGVSNGGNWSGGSEMPIDKVTDGSGVGSGIGNVMVGSETPGSETKGTETFGCGSP